MTSRAPTEQQASARPSPFTLSIRTATFDPKETREESPPPESQAGQLSYPIPIPEKKLVKALEIWDTYRKSPLKDGLAQLPTGPSTSSYLSPTSVASSQYPKAESIVSSANGDITERSSVISFDEVQSPISAKKTKVEYTTFDGKKVSTRIRKPFDPRAKAKTALIRCLGSCTSCRDRNVACPLEHHDTGHLERLWLSNSLGHNSHNSRSRKHLSHSSNSSSRDKSSTIARQRTTSAAGQGVNTTLLGIGKNFDSFAPDALDYSESQSPAGVNDPLAGIAIPNQPPYDLSSQDVLPDPLATQHSSFLPNTLDNQHSFYQAYQNGAQFPLGVLRQGGFFCQYLNDDKYCQYFCEDDEQLQTHFETAHFAFTRIDPAYRYICSAAECRVVSQEYLNQCRCGLFNTAELWICGNFIRVGYDERYAPDGQGLLYGEIPRTRYTSSYDSSSFDYGPGMGQDSNLFLNVGMHAGGHGFGGRSTYTESTGYLEDFDYAAQPPAGHGQGLGFGRAHQMSVHIASTTRQLYSKALHTYQQHKILILFITILFALALGIEAHTYLLTKAHHALPSMSGLRPSLPALGFIGVIFSFVTCWSAKHKLGERERWRRERSRPHRCPLHAFTPLTPPTAFFQCRQSTPDNLAWDAGCL